MTDQIPADDEWGEAEPGAPGYPEPVRNPHNHRFTVSFDPTKPPFVVVRAETAAEMSAALDELDSSGTYADMGRAYAALKAQGALGSGLGAKQTDSYPTPLAPPQGPSQVPNQPYPNQPGWQQAGAPQAPAPLPQGGGQQGGGRGPKPRPSWPEGVYRMTVPFNDKDQFKAYREQHQDAFRGKLYWAGKGDYWVHPSVVTSFPNYNPVPA